MLPLLLVITRQVEATDLVRLELSAMGFKAYYVETLASASGVIAQWHFDAALIEADGIENDVFDVLKALRQRGQIPALAVLRRDDEEFVLNLLAAGASQVLSPSPSPRVIVAHLHRLIELARPRLLDDSASVQLGPLWLNPRKGVATVNGVDAGLTASEFELLLMLASEPGELVQREAIGKTLRFGTAAERRRSADMHVCRIRRKLKNVGGDNLQIVTVYRQGYLLKLVSEPQTSVSRVAWTV